MHLYCRRLDRGLALGTGEGCSLVPMLRWFNNISLRIRLVVLIGLIVLAFAGFLMIFLPSTLGGMAEEGLERRARLVALVLSDALSSWVVFQDDDGAREFLDTIGPTAEVAFAEVRLISRGENQSPRLGDKSFAVWHPNLVPTASLSIPSTTVEVSRIGKDLLVAVLVSPPGKKISAPRTPLRQNPADAALGVLYLGFPLAGLQQQRADILRLGLFVSLGLALVGVILAYIVGTIVVRPIRTLTTVTANIVSEGDLTQQIAIDSKDEVGRLASNFRALVGKLQTIPRSLAQLADGVTSVSRTAVNAATAVSDGATTVQERVSAAAAAMHETTAALSSIADNVAQLHRSTEQSRRANVDIVEATRHIDRQAAEFSAVAENATHAVEDMTTAVKTIAQQIEGLNTSVETTVSAMDEINQSIRKIENTASETSSLSRRVAVQAGTGVATLERTLDGIHKINSSSLAVSSAIEHLGMRIQNIDTILEVILDVAAQTKLLALNASILAAQAGEHGRGFGVLAYQIKELAMRVNTSATEIGDLVVNVRADSETALTTMSAGLSHVGEGMTLAQEGMEVLNSIRKSADSASMMVQRIANATAEQSRSTQQVVASMNDVAKTVQKVKRATADQAKGTEQIVAASNQMRSSSELVIQSSSRQANATRGIAASLDTIHDLAASISRAQTEQKESAAHTLAAMEAIKTVGDRQMHAVATLSASVDTLQVQSEQLRQAIAQFRV